MKSIILTSSTYDVSDISPSTLKVLEYIVSSNGPQSPSDILEKVKCSRRSVQYALKDLTARGIIEKRPYFDDMRQSKYIIRAEIVKQRLLDMIVIHIM
ncbi:MAG: MarR family transcriptional regulator [Candidatus Odinarchaeota archaeon]